jgi:ketosteroid isomerase-like protein
MAATSVEAQLEEVLSRLRELEDERAILRTLYSYAHGLDYDYEDEWIDGWTEDAVLHWPHSELRGREQIGDAFRKHPHAPTTYWKHLLIEPRIELDGDRATVDSYFARLQTDDQGRPELASYGRYRDVLVRGDDGRWRMKERVTERESPAG